MGTSDNFCLRWNDFETNISSSFRELRRDSEFFDVTLCCDNGTDRVGAHKVILAACSPFFRRILGHNANTPNPLLYLKGIQKKELQAILNFMYHGEVNVAQESLNAFLSCAEELAVKGLTTDSKPVQASSAQGQAAAAVTGNTDGPNIDDDLDFAAPPAQSRVQHKQATPSTSSSAKKALATRKREADLSLDPEDSKKIKPEPESHLGGPEDAEFGPDDSYGGAGADFDDSYGGGGGGYEDMDESGAMEGSELTKVREEASFLRSKRGNAMLVDASGYHYFVNKKRETRMYWKCLKCRSHGCRARAVTEGFYIISKTAEHSHEPASMPPSTALGEVEYV